MSQNNTERCYGSSKLKNRSGLTAVNSALSPKTRDFYQQALIVLRDSKIPFMVGGTYAISAYTGIDRRTKDLDLFCKPEDFDAIMKVLAEALGCTVKLIYPHWLGKAFYGDDFIDIIFNSGNGIALVDDQWFENAVECEVLGVPNILLCPPEEVIWSKASIMERERYDGADVAHVILHQGETMDWHRTVARFGQRDYRVLLAHVSLFGYIYPKEDAEKKIIPEWVYEHLIGKLTHELRNPPVETEEKVCRGTLVSREQYLVDVGRWGYCDARLTSFGGGMSSEDIVTWTAAIDWNKR